MILLFACLKTTTGFLMQNFPSSPQINFKCFSHLTFSYSPFQINWITFHSLSTFQFLIFASLWSFCLLEILITSICTCKTPSILQSLVQMTFSHNTSPYSPNGSNFSTSDILFNCLCIFLMILIRNFFVLPLVIYLYFLPSQIIKYLEADSYYCSPFN